MKNDKIQNSKLISVIVPIYNSEKYLRSCIDSIIKQSYNNLEIILVNDGSTDRCNEICNSMAIKDPRIIYLRQKNRGVSAARNSGIEIASGEYITFVDSDDELLPDAIELMVQDVEEYNADIVTAVKCSINSKGEVSNPYENKILTLYKGLEPLCLSLDGDRQTNSACAKLFRREFIGSIRFEEGRHVNEDGFFIFLCYEKQPVLVQHNICVYKYYMRNDSSSRKSFSEKYFDMIYFSERKKQIIQEKHPELMDKIINMEVSTHLFFLEVLCRTTNKKYKKDEKYSKSVVKRNYKRYFSMYSHERNMAKIVRYGGYPLYKLLLRIKKVIRR